jgi:hypothetical protein
LSILKARNKAIRRQVSAETMHIFTTLRFHEIFLWGESKLNERARLLVQGKHEDLMKHLEKPEKRQVYHCGCPNPTPAA